MRGMRIWGRRWPNFLCRWQRGPTQPRREKQICENWPLITANQANNTPPCKMMYTLSMVLELSANSYLHCVDMKSWWCCKDGRECRIFHYAHFRCLPPTPRPHKTPPPRMVSNFPHSNLSEVSDEILLISQIGASKAVSCLFASIEVEGSRGKSWPPLPPLGEFELRKDFTVLQ